MGFLLYKTTALIVMCVNVSTINVGGNDVGGTVCTAVSCKVLDVLHMFGLLTCGTDTSMLYSAQIVRFRVKVPS